jgi:hypothetical protein
MEQKPKSKDKAIAERKIEFLSIFWGNNSRIESNLMVGS